MRMCMCHCVHEIRSPDYKVQYFRNEDNKDYVELIESNYTAGF